jgi:2',3'-cyclic-nucleotide 2'-phosphodiesterase (5'-nucleotidase family)
MCRLIYSLCIILLTFSCSPHWSVHQINTKNISIDLQSASIDSLVQSTVTPYRDSIEQDMSKLVTVSATPLIKGKPESNLTNTIADILLGFGTEFCAKQNLKINPDLAYVNYGGLRASLPQGEITVGRIFELMPFENEIVLIKISGEAIHQMAERIADRGGEGVSGMKMGIRDGKLASFTIGGKPVDLSVSYWLVTNDYIASGGDQMAMFLNPLDRINTQMKFRDLLIQELSNRYKKDGILNVKLDGRIYHEQ